MTACSWERHPEEEIQRVFPPEKWRQHRVAIAVSGGADSVSLARAFVSLAENCHQRSQLVFLHVNHQMRGKESDGDADFVRLLAKRHQIPYGEYRVNPGELQRAYQSSGSWEAAARAIRYRLLLTAAEEYECRFLATAHTADDQLETILYRLFRGTGPAGLAGIPFIRPLNDMVLLIRPFLALYRTDIISYLDSLNQSFRVDSSNLSSKYMRNRVRHELIPALDSLFSGDWRTALRRLSQTANEIQSSLLDSEKSLDQKWNVYQAEEHLFQRDLMFTEESGNNPGDGRGKTIRNKRENEPGNRVRNNIERTMEHGVNCLTEPDGKGNGKNVGMADDTGHVPSACPDECVQIPLVIFDDESDLNIRNYLWRIWQRQNWHLAEMGNSQWRRLITMIREKKTGTEEFPGNIVAQIQTDVKLTLHPKNR